jgi:HNH endonuclease/AP2 domain
MGRRSDIKPLPSLERLNELLSYDENTGVLTWKMQPATSRSNICHNNKCGGKVAGTVGAKGYIMIGIGKVYYLAHRIIWKMKTGVDPLDIIDHEDTDRGNNRWTNLREAANGPNIQNSKLRKDNVSGVKGVHWDSQHRKWRAVISANGKSQRLGRFSSIEEATNVISAARLQMHGEFARSN